MTEPTKDFRSKSLFIGLVGCAVSVLIVLFGHGLGHALARGWGFFGFLRGDIWHGLILYISVIVFLPALAFLIEGIIYTKRRRAERRRN